MRRLLPALMLAVSLASVAPAGSPRDDPRGVDHDAFDEILRTSVRGERVDYGTVRRQGLDALERYLSRLAGVDPAALARDARLAYFINLYNATMIRAVVERAGDGWTAAADEFAVFDEPLVRSGGRTMSLNYLEHSVVRPEFGDPRIHAALVCAAASCPPLLDRAYRAENLDETLDARMRAFVNDGTRNRLDHDARRLRLSSIFDWYADDFGGRDALDAYVDRYVTRDVRGYEIEFLPYSWDLNGTE